jgi:NADH-quinone oxidoreductase subunit C
MTATEAIASIKQHFAGAIESEQEFRGERTIAVKLDQLHDVLAHCQGKLAFDYLTDICSLDHEGEDPRFEMVYHLYGLGHHTHLRVRSTVAEDGSVQTVTDLWPTANWHEREVYDMMGIQFGDHPDLRRILMWEGYPFYPLRKEFPLAGKPSDMPEVAFTGIAPLEGGPFVTEPSTAGTGSREPRPRG